MPIGGNLELPAIHVAARRTINLVTIAGGRVVIGGSLDDAAVRAF